MMEHPLAEITREKDCDNVQFTIHLAGSGLVKDVRLAQEDCQTVDPSTFRPLNCRKARSCTASKQTTQAFPPTRSGCRTETPLLSRHKPRASISNCRPPFLLVIWVRIKSSPPSSFAGR